MVIYEIHDREGPIQSAPYFSTLESAIELARTYALQGRQEVRIDRLETVWKADEMAS